MIRTEIQWKKVKEVNENENIKSKEELLDEREKSKRDKFCWWISFLIVIYFIYRVQINLFFEIHIEYASIICHYILIFGNFHRYKSDSGEIFSGFVEWKTLRSLSGFLFHFIKFLLEKTTDLLYNAFLKEKNAAIDRPNIHNPIIG